MSYEYSDKLDNIARERYKSKLVASGLDMCPYKLEAGRWINDPTKWPEVSWPDIYNYLVETPGVFTKTAMKNYRSLEAYNYAVSGLVGAIFYHVTSSGAFLLKADVKSSQRLNDEPHHPWVTTKTDGEVLTAHCDCMAGLGESCSHVAALLFKVEATQRFDKTKSVCTDHPCTWNQCFTRKVEPAPIHRISFFKEASKERLRQKESKERKRRKVNITSSTPEQKSDFMQELASGTSRSIGSSSFKEHCGPFVPTSVAPQVPDLPINLRSVYCEENSLNADNMERARANCVDKLQITAAQRKYLIDNSIDQSNSTTWHEIRVGRITASRVHAVMHTDQSRPAPSVIKNIIMPSRNLNHLPAIQWGREHEEEALDKYIEAHRKHLHPNATAKKTGLWLHEEYSYLGASPDGLLRCDVCGPRVLEIKCPYSQKDCKSIEEMLTMKNCCVEEDGEDIVLKKNHTYYSQVQFQMYCCQVEQCDFILWTPRKLIVCTTDIDQEFVDSMAEKLPAFWHTHILPELLCRSLENDV